MNTSKPDKTSKSALSFKGTSSTGDLTEALKNALKAAAEELPDKVPWEIKRIGGDQLHGSLSVTIQTNPGEGEGLPDKGPKIPTPPPPPPNL